MQGWREKKAAGSKEGGLGREKEEGREAGKSRTWRQKVEGGEIFLVRTKTYRTVATDLCWK